LLMAPTLIPPYCPFPALQFLSLIPEEGEGEGGAEAERGKAPRECRAVTEWPREGGDLLAVAVAVVVVDYKAIGVVGLAVAIATDGRWMLTVGSGLVLGALFESLC